MARSFIYRFLAKAYEDPTEVGWSALTSEEALRALRSSVQSLSGTQALQSTEIPANPKAPNHTLGSEALKNGPCLARFAQAAHALERRNTSEPFECFHSSYLEAFGHAARGRCPLNEIEYGDVKADPLFQPHRLADLAGFYNAFGVELADDADERPDHICLELEFMCVLAAKEAYALEHQLDVQELSLCRDAQRKFLREHLGRWLPGFSRRLSGMCPDSALDCLAGFTGSFVETECALLRVPCGSEDILLRPLDPAETLCASCGPVSPLPGGFGRPEGE